MSNDFSYRSYVTDQQFLDEYSAYQAKYAKQLRESHKVRVGLVREIIEWRDGRITLPAAEGKKLASRGTLIKLWCHLTAQRQYGRCGRREQLGGWVVHCE